MQYFTICDEKNPGSRIIELICYCFLTDLGILFFVHKLNYLIKNATLMQYKDFVPIYPYLISEGDEIEGDLISERRPALRWNRDSHETCYQI